MSKPFQHFLPETKKILVQAQKIADQQSRLITTSHILAAIVRLQDSVGCSILMDQGLDPDKLELSLSIVKEKKIKKRKISEEVKSLIKNSMVQAKKLNHRVVGPEHLLLAICLDKGCQAFKLLKDLDLDPKRVAAEIKGLFNKAKQAGEGDPFSPMVDQFPGEMEEMDQLGTQLMMPNQRPAKDQKILPAFATDLVAEAKKKKLDPLIGREKELSRMVKILNRRTKNNPVLVGEAGVGKTAIVEGLAQKIDKGNIPTELKGKKVLSLDLGLLLAGTKYRGQFEKRIKKIVKEIKEDPNIILFLDEIHTLAGAGAAEGSIDAANIIKPALARGDLRLIGSTTLDEYRKHIEKDNALERRLQMIKVGEPTPEETSQILEGLKENYQKHHKVVITPEAIKAAVELSERYITDRQLPDKAIDLIDEAASAQSMADSENQIPTKTEELQEKIEKAVKDKERAVVKQDYEKAASQRERELKLKSQLLRKKQGGQRKKKKGSAIGPEEIGQVVSEWVGVPVTSLIKEERERYQDIEKKVKEKIIGQDAIIKKLTQAIKRSRTGVAQEDRPIGSFVFLGPTGVGKTELAKALSETLFDRPDALVRVDMSEFMEKHNLSRLVGAPPGYVGYEEGGKLTEQIRRNPYSVVLLDEIEKAHVDVQNILLQILEDGQITDSQGRKVDFSNTVIIMTSNIGTKALSKEAAVGFQATGNEKKQVDNRYRQMRRQILSKVKDRFRPEFLNRIDEILVFRPLRSEDIKKIVKIQLNELKDRLKKQKEIKLEITEGAVNYLAKHGFHPDLGARPIRRIITQKIENKVSEKLLQANAGEKIKVTKGRNKNKGLRVE